VRIVRPKSVRVGHDLSTPTAEPLQEGPCNAHQHQAKGTASFSETAPICMKLDDRDNLVRVAHALFYVGLVLALLWMFSCRSHVRSSDGERGGNFSFAMPGTLNAGLWYPSRKLAHHHSLSLHTRFPLASER
jgi:hypothetical protein